MTFTTWYLHSWAFFPSILSKSRIWVDKGTVYLVIKIFPFPTSQFCFSESFPIRAVVCLDMWGKQKWGHYSLKTSVLKTITPYPWSYFRLHPFLQFFSWEERSIFGLGLAKASSPTPQSEWVPWFQPYLILLLSVVPTCPRSRG